MQWSSHKAKKNQETIGSRLMLAMKQLDHFGPVTLFLSLKKETVGSHL